MEKKGPEIWGVPVGAPELADLTQNQLAQLRTDMAQRQREETQRQIIKSREILGLPPTRKDVVS